MSLKIELDFIYERIYMMKESLSAEESSILIAGFEDGINEGIGKWLGKAAGWISDTPRKLKKSVGLAVDKARDLYKKGKEWAGNAIDKMKAWMSDAYEKIAAWMSDAGKWISEKYDIFVQKMEEAFSAMGKKLVELWEATKEKSKALFEATKNLFERIVDSVKKGYYSAKEKLSRMGDGISAWVKRNWERLKEGYVAATDKLSDMYRSAIEALKKGGLAAKKWIRIVALKLVIIPAKKAVKWLKKLPSLYKEYMDRLKKFIDSEVQEFKLGFEQGAGRPWDRAKGFINKTEYPEIKVDAPRPEVAMHSIHEDPFAKAGDSLREKGFLMQKYAQDPQIDKNIEDAEKSAQSEIGDAAEALVKDPLFKKRFINYSESDLRSVLKSNKFKPMAIDWICAWIDEEKSKKPKKTMSLPESRSFKHLKTFEGFEY